MREEKKEGKHTRKKERKKKENTRKKKTDKKEEKHTRKKKTKKEIDDGYWKKNYFIFYKLFNGGRGEAPPAPSPPHFIYAVKRGPRGKPVILTHSNVIIMLSLAS